jgi:glucosamine-6-phosphate deaminase
MAKDLCVAWCRSSRSSKTRLIDLDAVTRTDAAADFFGEENVPYQAITMGVETVLKVCQP